MQPHGDVRGRYPVWMYGLNWRCLGISCHRSRVLVWLALFHAGPGFATSSPSSWQDDEGGWWWRGRTNSTASISRDIARAISAAVKFQGSSAAPACFQYHRDIVYDTRFICPRNAKLCYFFFRSFISFKLAHVTRTTLRCDYWFSRQDQVGGSCEKLEEFAEPGTATY